MTKIRNKALKEAHKDLYIFDNQDVKLKIGFLGLLEIFSIYFKSKG